jgi:hypothetical protein
MRTPLTYPALPRRTVQQADKFAPFSCLRRVLIHRLQSRAHAIIWCRRYPALGFIPERIRRGVDICCYEMSAGPARADIRVHVNIRTC